MARRSSIVRCRHVVCAIGLAMLSVAGAVQGQTAAGVPVGARVRVAIPDSLRQVPFAAPGRALVGTLERETADSLYLRVAGSAPFGIERSQVRGIQVSRGVSRARSALEAGRQSAFMGAMIGVVDSRFGSRAGQEWPRWEQALIGAGIGAAFGAVLGIISPFETWRRVRQ